MDYHLFQLINNLAGRWWFLDFLGIFFAKYLIFVMFFAAVSLFIVWKDEAQKKIYQNAAFKIFSAVAFGYILKIIVQFAYQRPRPFVVYEVFKLIDKSADASFPSGHTVLVFALAFSIYFYNKKLGALFLVLAALVGFGRIFVGVHYPLDVLGGIFIGALSAFIVQKYLSHPLTVLKAGLSALFSRLKPGK